MKNLGKVAKMIIPVASYKTMVGDMSTVSYSFRIDEETKEQFDDICQGMGMSPATAYNIFAKRVVAERALPFTPAIVEPVEGKVTTALREIQNKARGYHVTEEEVLDLIMSGRS